jgi:hypothetical protein
MQDFGAPENYLGKYHHFHIPRLTVAEVMLFKYTKWAQKNFTLSKNTKNAVYL